MKSEGNEPGDMKPHVEDYQRPSSDFSQEGFSKTLDYISRQDKHQATQANKIKKESYNGRYS